MKTNQPLDIVKEENSAFGAELLSQKKQCHIVCEECDSFKLALQIVTKDLYHKNEIKPGPWSDQKLAQKVQKDSKPNADKANCAACTLTFSSYNNILVLALYLNSLTGKV